MRRALLLIGILALLACAFLFMRERSFRQNRENTAIGLVTNFDSLRNSNLDPNSGAFSLYGSFHMPPSETMVPIRYFLRSGLGIENAASALTSVDFNTIQQLAERSRLLPVMDWDRPTRFDLTWVGKSGGAAELLACRAMLEAQDGSVDRCARDIERIVAIVDHLAQFGITFTYASRERALRSLSLCVTTACIQFEADQAALQKILDALSGLRECDERDAIKFDLAMGLGTIGELARGEISIEDLSRGSPALTSPPSNLETAVFRSDRRRIEDYFVREFARIARHWGDYKALSLAMDEFNERKIDLSDVVDLHADTVSRILVPPLDFAFRTEAKNLVHTRATKIGVAAFLLRSKEGGWPTIGEAAGLAGVSMKDPFGTDLRFTPSKSRLLIYSIYTDGTDEGGNPVRQFDSGPFDVVGFGRYR